MIITLTTSITVDVDSIKTYLFDQLWDICYDGIPGFAELSDDQQDEVKNAVWNKIIK
jgi:hypothetical protein